MIRKTKSKAIKIHRGDTHDIVELPAFEAFDAFDALDAFEEPEEEPELVPKIL